MSVTWACFTIYCEDNLTRLTSWKRVQGRQIRRKLYWPCGHFYLFAYSFYSIPEDVRENWKIKQLCRPEARLSQCAARSTLCVQGCTIEDACFFVYQFQSLLWLLFLPCFPLLCIILSCVLIITLFCWKGTITPYLLDNCKRKKKTTFSKRP